MSHRLHAELSNIYFVGIGALSSDLETQLKEGNEVVFSFPRSPWDIIHVL